jgi:alpha-galactosidase
MKEKLVLIGAGSAMFTGALVTEVVKRGWDCELALVDTDPEALAIAEGLTKKVIAAKRARTKLAASTDRRQVLRGATIVVTTIAVGGRRAWEQDVIIPRKYGIYQPVGDSVMPGGTSRCLRMIPPMVAIARTCSTWRRKPLLQLLNYDGDLLERKATARPSSACSGVAGVGEQLRYMPARAGSPPLRSAEPPHPVHGGRRARMRCRAARPGRRGKRSVAVFGVAVLRFRLPAVGDGHVLEFFPRFAKVPSAGRRSRSGIP